MKTINNIFIILLLLVTGPSVNAQVDIFGALAKTAEMHNEEEADKEAGTEREDPGSVIVEPELTEMEKEQKKKWEEDWKKKMEENAELLEALDEKYLRCTALMGLYVYEYLQLEKGAESEENCRLKYDLYGMQLLALTTSTTIMYCPEEMTNLSNTDYRHTWEEFRKAIFEVPHYSSQRLWIKMQFLLDYFGRYPGDYDVSRNEHLIYEHLIPFFHPYFIAPKTLQIGRKMEALGCGG